MCEIISEFRHRKQILTQPNPTQPELTRVTRTQSEFTKLKAELGWVDHQVGLSSSWGHHISSWARIDLQPDPRCTLDDIDRYTYKWAVVGTTRLWLYSLYYDIFYSSLWRILIKRGLVPLPHTFSIYGDDLQFTRAQQLI